MSLVVARQSEGEITIVSETKLTYPHHDSKRQQTNPEEGTIKTVIINEQVSVSFAGERDFAAEALEKINSGDSVEDIIKILKQAHQDSGFKTDFIVCYLLPKPTIYKIKNQEYGEVVSAWIGDAKAFELFQTFFMGGKINNGSKKEKKNEKKRKGSYIHVEEMNLGVTGPASSLASRMCTAMDKLIEEGSVRSVGGFRVHLKMKEASVYNFYMQTYQGGFTVEIQGSMSIPIGNGDAQGGAYSVYFLGGSPDHQHAAIHLRQGNIGLVYSRVNNGIFKPTLLKMDEVDFLDHVQQAFNINGPFTTMDRTAKFANDGIVLFKENRFDQALLSFDKALATAEGKQQAELIFYKGVTFSNLRDIDQAKRMFMEAFRLNPLLQPRIEAVFAQNPNDWR